MKGLLLVALAAALSLQFNITGAPSAQPPGPNAALYSSHPYYTCASNVSVTTLAQLQSAASATHPPGTCINVAPAVYALSGVNPLTFAHGGVAPSPTAPFPATNYVVWRCNTMPLSTAGGSVGGEGAGCVLRQSGTNGGSLAFLGASYIMFDGFEFDGSNNATQGNCLDNEHSNGAIHHTWLLNSDLHHCGQSGIQWNGTDWLYVLNSVWHDNSNTNGVNGSGASFYEPVLTPSYTVTTQDMAFQSTSAGVVFHIVVNNNVMYHNFNNFAGCTDGEGVIFDDWGWTQNTGQPPYAGHGLAMGNVAYFNGGGGIQVFSKDPSTGQLWFVNNTAYDNYWSTCNSGTWRADFFNSFSSNVKIINNIGYAILGSGVAADNAAFVGKHSATTGNVWANNVAFPSVFGPSAAGFDAPNTFPTTGVNANLDNTNPGFVSVTPNSITNNFALQSTSPAIGEAQAFDLWHSNDAGACDHTLTQCP